MKIIKETDIKEQIQQIKKLSGDLDQYISEFTTYTNEIQEVLIGLSVCLNTTGGTARIKEISNIEFDNEALNNIANEIDNITVTYKQEKQYT